MHTLILNYLSLEAPADIFFVIKCNTTQKWCLQSNSEFYIMQEVQVETNNSLDAYEDL